MKLLKSFYLNPSHMLSPSPWPFVASSVLFTLTGGLVLWWSNFQMSFPFYIFFFLVVLMVLWWGDVCFESGQGAHSLGSLKFFRVGMVLFILSEVLFFFSFFWSFFHTCFANSLETGGCWPPYSFSLVVMDPFSIPLLKTVLLLSSGVTMTSSHHYLLVFKYGSGAIMLLFTLVLGVLFLLLQIFEYSESMIGMKSSSYGSCFFLLTGFHGLHVMVGGLMLFVSLHRLLLGIYSKSVHPVFELSAWYWHFVDVVWLFLYVFLYWFGYLLMVY